jgi:hypothetical protein
MGCGGLLFLFTGLLIIVYCSSSDPYLLASMSVFRCRNSPASQKPFLCAVIKQAKAVPILLKIQKINRLQITDSGIF